MPGVKNALHFYYVKDENYFILNAPFLNGQSEVIFLFAIRE